jgi:hypothetical protein
MCLYHVNFLADSFRVEFRRMALNIEVFAILQGSQIS